MGSSHSILAGRLDRGESAEDPMEEVVGDRCTSEGASVWGSSEWWTRLNSSEIPEYPLEHPEVKTPGAEPPEGMRPGVMLPDE